MRFFAPLLLAACLPRLHAADLPALPAEIPAEVRPHLQTLQRYYREVERRQSGGRAASPGSDSSGKTSAAASAEADAKPAAAPRAERDPFAVTPELRNQRGGRGSTAIGMNLYPMSVTERTPPLKLKAIVTGSRPAALVEYEESGGRQAEVKVVRLYEGELLTLSDGSVFRVKAIRPGLVSFQTGTDPNNEYLLR